MKILKTVTDTDRKPFVLVAAADAADAEIFATENAVEYNPYFEGMETGTAQETSIEGTFKVPFN
jgi:hypothetical protein